MEHVCAYCKYVEESKRAACAAAKIKRQQSLSTFRQAEWDAVKEHRLPLAEAILLKDWNKVYELKQIHDVLLAKAING